MATIHTKKNIFQNNQDYLSEKIKLFNNLTINMIIKELKNNNIDVVEKEIVSKYKETYNFNAVIDVYNEKYDNELDALGEKGELFDDDAIIYLCIKIIEKNFDIHSVPDIDYIAEDVKDILQHECDDVTLMKKVNKQLKRLNKAANYLEEKNLQALFDQYQIDIEQFFTRAFSQIAISNCPTKVLEELYLGLMSLKNNYDLSLRYGEISAKVLSRCIKDKVDYCKYVEDLNEAYPTLKLNTYYAVLEALQSQNNKEYMKEYLARVQAYAAQNEAEKDFQAVIMQVFKN